MNSSLWGTILYSHVKGEFGGDAMSTTYKSLSQKATRDGLGTVDNFRGGVWVTKNGAAELFVQTAEERQEELQKSEHERQIYALLKLTLLAKKDMQDGRFSTVDDVRARLRAARTIKE